MSQSGSDPLPVRDIRKLEVSRIMRLTNYEKRDIKERIKADHKKKIIEDKTNNIHFYDIEVDTVLPGPLSKGKSLLPSFKDVSKGIKETPERLEGKGWASTSKDATSFSFSSMGKRSNSETHFTKRPTDFSENRLQLSEIYKLMDIEKESESKQSTPSVQKINKDKAVSHDSEIEVIRNLDSWTLKNRYNKNIQERKMKSLKQNGTIETERFIESSPLKKKPRHQKTVSEFGPIDLQSFTNDSNELPVVNRISSESPKVRRRSSISRMEERIHFRKEKYQAVAEMENMRKSIRESLNLDKTNSYQEEMKLKLIIAEKKEKEKEEQRKNNLASLKQHIQAFLEITFDDPNYPPLLEKVAFIERQSSEINDKILRKIKDLTALIENKQYAARCLRRDNKLFGDKIIKMKFERASLKKIMSEHIATPSPAQLERPKNFSVSTKSSENKDFAPSTVEKRFRSISNSVLTSNISRSLYSISRSVLAEERDQKIKSLLTQEKEYKSLIDYNKEKIDEMEENLQEDKLELKNYYKIHREFLYIILKDGRDVRRRGLSWIIRVIWSLGEPVYEQSLPDFLDPKAKDFLIAKSKLENNMEELLTLQRVSLDIYKNSKSADKHSESFFNMSSMKFSSDKTSEANYEDRSSNSDLFFSSGNPEAENYLYFSNKSIMSELTRSKYSTNDMYIFELKAKIKKTLYPSRQDSEQDSAKELLFSQPKTEPSQLNNETIKLFEDGKQINNYPDRDSFMKEYEALQGKIGNLEKSFHKLYQDEVERIIKEFDFKSYSKRYKIDCASVLAALFGVKNANREMLRYGMSGK